jgi:hypothetical protein
MQLLVDISIDNPVYNLESEPVTRICRRRTPINISSKLVEQHYQGQRAIRRRLPIRQRPLAGTRHKRTKTGPDFIVYRRAAVVPPIATGQRGFRTIQTRTQPKRDDFIDGFSAQDTLPNE